MGIWRAGLLWAAFGAAGSVGCQGRPDIRWIIGADWNVPTSLSVSADNAFLATTNAPFVYIFSLPDLRMVRSWQVETQYPYSNRAAFSPTAPELATCGVVFSLDFWSE